LLGFEADDIIGSVVNNWLEDAEAGPDCGDALTEVLLICLFVLSFCGSFVRDYVSRRKPILYATGDVLVLTTDKDMFQLVSECVAYSTFPIHTN
jgi:hypothetical protein